MSVPSLTLLSSLHITRSVVTVALSRREEGRCLDGKSTALHSIWTVQAPDEVWQVKRYNQSNDDPSFASHHVMLESPQIEFYFFVPLHPYRVWGS